MDAIPNRSKLTPRGHSKLWRGLNGPYGAAITELDISLGTMKNNEPINRREGNIAQADLERDNAKSYRAAIRVLGRQRADEMR